MSKLSFGQRLGLESKVSGIQLNSLNDPARIDLYNAYYVVFYQPFLEYAEGTHARQPFFHTLIWSKFLRRTVDSLPSRHLDFIGAIKHLILEGNWYNVYNFWEYVFGILPNIDEFHIEKNQLIDHLNELMTRNNTAYRIKDETFVPITNETELEEIQNLEDNLGMLQLSTVYQHLATSLKLLALKPEPDLRNSIKESISMVGAIARLIEPSNDLSKSLHLLEKQNLISPSLSNKFQKFYHYTNDKGGIRHELMDESNLSLAEARYFLVACSAFSNYLIDKAITNDLFPMSG